MSNSNLQPQVVTLDIEPELRIATLCINRPEKRGALSQEVVVLLAQLFSTLGSDPGVSAVILRSEGPGSSAGDDLMGTPPQAHEAQACIRAMELCDVPVILAAHGFVFTGALELALGADLIVAGDETKFQDTHAQFGLVPTWGLPARLPNKVGLARANQIMMLGQPFTAHQAESWGLVNVVVPETQVLAEARKMALQAAQLSRSALGKTKRMMIEANSSSLGDALSWTGRFHPGQGADVKERIQVLFSKSSRGKPKSKL